MSASLVIYITGSSAIFSVSERTSLVSINLLGYWNFDQLIQKRMSLDSGVSMPNSMGGRESVDGQNISAQNLTLLGRTQLKEQLGDIDH